jgi:hypothetical protein
MASRTMALTGSLLLLFIVFHILHLTVGLGDPSFHDQLDERGHRDVYGKVVQAFHNPFYVALYCAGQLVLGMHLSHAVSGSLQTLGLEHAALIRLFRAAGPAVALFVVMGNLAIIFAVFVEKLVSPGNKRRLNIIVVGTGLAGASAASTLGQLGYQVECFCSQDSPRRAHSIAAQGGINAAKNYQDDGDSVARLFYDTIKGGDFRSREANVYRLAQVSTQIIDQCVALGVPFAREYGGQLANRSFGGVQVARTRPNRTAAPSGGLFGFVLAG